MTALPLVRLVDDDTDLLEAQTQSLRIAGFLPEAFSSATAALQSLDADYPGVILSDVRMPGMDGFELFRRIRAIDPELPVILLTGHGDVAMAVAAIRDGAWDFLTKPVGLDALTAALRRAVQARALVLENRQLRALRGVPVAAGQLLGDSTAMVHLRDTVARLAEAGVDALITGPSGAGKTLLARAIHREGPRHARAFVHVACDALDAVRFDLDFIGAEAGQPGAPRHTRLVGRLEKAHRGTLFLDRIDRLSLPQQARILHVIEAREVWAAGASAARAVDLHVLAATQADLGAMVARGEFLPDLYYRLSGVTLHVPALKDRRGDIPILFRHFLLAACGRLNLPVPQITPLTQARLATHDWPGNARELMQFAESLALGLPAFGGEGAGEDVVGLSEMMAAYEAGVIREALLICGGNVSRAMERLRLPRKTFYDKVNRLGIRPEGFRGRGK
ncbi:MAG: sigma-54 dependent transcriptional regulator [Cypionkella sp.]|uniref:sigma-54-dependent transcriptional regulator n=1 Tax=Cypionkella sp. TaxID=2811411 RepID=UPI002AB84B0F|nr:sigma-54 dependent transcriptional regulator [Cypionkella sp.]MDZ4310694.1 sigma-54 dependent transcriptional regulator [Cypionkella sp.]